MVTAAEVVARLEALATPAGFDVAARLCADPEPSVHKAVGIFLAHAGTRSPESLAAFLAEHGDAMPAAAHRLATRKQGKA